jgi:hypothetical protein
MVAAPVGAFPAAVRVSVLVLEVEPGLKDAVTPLGTPDTESETLPLKPSAGLTVMVLLTLEPPCLRVTLLGAAESAKSGVPGLPAPAPPQPITDPVRQTTTANSSQSFSRVIDFVLFISLAGK